ncbi:protein kinase [Saccharomycopsis crataegensis]|uniref:Serine/threonine-protein kinase RIO2 n=1 Tax=Saccharomycopsis crataegensis TaxID=43959 RepID=A0AAV5QTE6_9ASCO|nr:protein kinase [Saccharomycopsis crataegensis]
MKLDISQMRYLSGDDYRVLNAVEMGSKDHDLVPTYLIKNLSKVNPGAVNRSVSTLAKHRLISKVRNAKYDGYKLSYLGHDYLALKSMLKRDSLESLGTTVGVGKESDIFSTVDKNGLEKILKVHRLGRTSFRSVKSKRDYLKKNTGGSWMFLSKVAAGKEFQFLTTLYDNGFNVPKTYDYSRHCILMQWVEGYPMTKLYEFKDYKKLYSELMKFIVKLANYGLIHCDFNEFNIMIRDHEIIESGEFPDDFVVLDFPQSISIDHPEADYYFNRDVDCIKLFFKKRFKYEPVRDSSMLDTDGYGEGYKYIQPDFKRDVKRVSNIDELLQASGFKKKHGAAKLVDREFEEAMNNMRSQEIVPPADDGEEDEEKYESGEEGYSEYDEDDDDDIDFDSEDEIDDAEDNENERIIEALQSGVENLKMDKLGNYILDE